jgi:uncharacterized protein YigE (DUF2233 family)
MNLCARAVFLSFFLIPSIQALNSSVLSDSNQNQYRVLKLDPRVQTLELHWKDSSGKPLKTFAALEQALKTRQKTLLAATNAGIFTKSFAPLGLHLEWGKVQRPLNLGRGYGNFYLQPNGVFYFGSSGAGILETAEFGKSKLKPDYATQSGPLLVQRGKINPAFTPNSSNRKIRSGVGVSRTGKVYWVLSSARVNFYDFASFFRNVLECPNALFLDGTISKLYIPGDKTARDEGSGPFAGFLTVLER